MHTIFIDTTRKKDAGWKTDEVYGRYFQPYISRKELLFFDCPFETWDDEKCAEAIKNAIQYDEDIHDEFRLVVYFDALANVPFYQEMARDGWDIEKDEYCYLNAISILWQCFVNETLFKKLDARGRIPSSVMFLFKESDYAEGHDSEEEITKCLCELCGLNEEVFQELRNKQEEFAKNGEALLKELAQTMGGEILFDEFAKRTDGKNLLEEARKLMQEHELFKGANQFCKKQIKEILVGFFGEGKKAEDAVARKDLKIQFRNSFMEAPHLIGWQGQWKEVYFSTQKNIQSTARNSREISKRRLTLCLFLTECLYQDNDGELWRGGTKDELETDRYRFSQRGNEEQATVETLLKKKRDILRLYHERSDKDLIDYVARSLVPTHKRNVKKEKGEKQEPEEVSREAILKMGDGQASGEKTQGIGDFYQIAEDLEKAGKERDKKKEKQKAKELKKFYARHRFESGNMKEELARLGELNETEPDARLKKIRALIEVYDVKNQDEKRKGELEKNDLPIEDGILEISSVYRESFETDEKKRDYSGKEKEESYDSQEVEYIEKNKERCIYKKEVEKTKKECEHKLDALDEGLHFTERASFYLLLFLGAILFLLPYLIKSFSVYLLNAETADGKEFLTVILILSFLVVLFVILCIARGRERKKRNRARMDAFCLAHMSMGETIVKNVQEGVEFYNLLNYETRELRKEFGYTRDEAFYQACYNMAENKISYHRRELAILQRAVDGLLDGLEETEGRSSRPREEENVLEKVDLYRSIYDGETNFAFYSVLTRKEIEEIAENKEQRW